MKKIKNEIIKNYNFLSSLGFGIGSEGNISVKEGEDIYITPSGIDIKYLTTDKISVIDIEGKIKNRVKPSSEVDMHLSVYKKREEFKAIVHCHSDWATILSCMRKKISTFHYMIAEFGGDDIKCSKYATFGSKELAKYVLNATKNRKGCLIANHGQICFGENLQQAIHLSQALEKLSKQFYFCLISKSYKKLSKREIRDVLKIFPSYKSKH